MELPSGILERIAKGYKENGKVIGASVEEGLPPGDNFMSMMYRVRLRLEGDENGEEEEIRAMLKCLPQDPLCTKIVEDCDSFAKEIGMYTKVLQDMKDFQRMKMVKDNEVFKGWPAAYSVESDEDFKFLAMEDLQVRGFKMVERSCMLDIVHTELVLQGLAHFHALSFAMFQGQYDSILSKYPFLQEQMFRDQLEISSSQKTFIKMAFEAVSTILHKAGESKAVEMWESLNDNFQYFDIMHKLVGSPVKNAVITFGDCWKNNILFRYKTKDDSSLPVDVSFVDFQLARVSSRIIDLSYFMYSSVDLDILNNNESHLLKFYHEQFKSKLRQLGVTPKRMDCTWKKFQKEYDQQRIYGVVQGLLLSPALYPPSSGEILKSDIDTSDINTKLIFENDDDSCNVELQNETYAEITKRICEIASTHLRKCNL